LATWEAERATDPDAQPPDPSAPFEEVLAKLFFDFQLFGRIDNFKLTLHAPVKPHMTNGVWDDEQKTVVWDVFLGANNELPTLCHAWWSAPNVDAQMRHFGQVLLDEEQLSEYAYWYTSLSDEERGEWDAFLGGLSAGPDLATQLEQFRFRTEAALPPDQQEGTHLARGRELMVQQIAYRANQAETIIVADVDMFPGHITCDSSSKSEIVIPLIQTGKLLGVLDIDSYELNSFGIIDKNYLEEICKFLCDEIFPSNNKK